MDASLGATGQADRRRVVLGGEADVAGSEGALPVVLSLFPLETVDGWPGVNSSATSRRRPGVVEVASVDALR